MKLCELMAALSAFSDPSADVSIMVDIGERKFDRRRNVQPNTVVFDVSLPIWREPDLLVSPTDLGIDMEAQDNYAELQDDYRKLKETVRHFLSLPKVKEWRKDCPGDPVNDLAEDLEKQLKVGTKA